MTTDAVEIMNNSSESHDSNVNNSVARSEHEMLSESFTEDKNSLDGSFEEVDFNRRNFSDYQDDRKLVKIAAVNDKYKLVERPRFLFSFETTTWENKFQTWIFRKHFATEMSNFISKIVFDIILAQSAI